MPGTESDELILSDRLVSLIDEIADVEGERIYDPTKPSGVMGLCSDNEKIEAELGWSACAALREGMAGAYCRTGEQVRRDLAGEREGANVFAEVDI